MKSALLLAGALTFLLPLLAACQQPTYSSAHPDARNSGPFWERNEQRD